MAKIIMPSWGVNILNLLLDGEKTLTEMSERLGVSKTAALKHLNELERFGMIVSETNTTRIGREKRFRVDSFSMVMSFDPDKGALVYSNSDPLYIKSPLVGQVLQDEFRKKVAEYLTEITQMVEIDFTIILYGSIARGEGTSKSDIDLLLLSKNRWGNNERNAVMKALHEGAIATQVQVKPLFWTLSEFLNKRDNLTKRIKNEGLILYSALRENRLWKSMRRYWNITD